MRYLAIFGSGGLGCQTADVAQRQNSVEGNWDEIIFVEDNPNRSEYFGLEVLGLDEALRLSEESAVEFVVALGDPVVRRDVFMRLKSLGCEFANVISPTAIVFRDATLGKGLIIQDYTMIEPWAVVGDNINVQDYSAVGHDCILADHCSVSAGVNIGGDNIVGEGTYFGLHSVTREGLKIGSYSTIGMGSVVIRDVPDCVVVVGNPAKIIRERDESTKVLGRNR